MSGSLVQQFPSRNSTWFDPKTGMMNPVPYNLIRSLWVRTGGGVADATANGLQSQITSQSVRIDTEAANTALNTTAISSLSTNVASNYAPKASPVFTGTPVVPGYLTTVVASATFITSAAAATTYLTITTASSTYLTVTSATSTYLTMATAASTYAPQASPVFTGTITTPAVSVTGTAAANALTASTTVLAGAGVGVFGHAAPVTQPGIPATLADVIAVLRGCGLTA